MTSHDLAKKYIDEQLAIIKKHGGPAKIDPERRKQAIADAEETFKAQRESSCHHDEGRKLHLRQFTSQSDGEQCPIRPSPKTTTG